MDRLNISPLRGSKMLGYNYIYNHYIPSGLVAGAKNGQLEKDRIVNTSIIIASLRDWWLVQKKSRRDDKIVENDKPNQLITNPEGVK